MEMPAPVRGPVPEPKEDIEQKLRDFLEKGRDWQRAPVKGSPGVFVLRAPGTRRRGPSLMIEINPVDENGLPTKRRGLIIRTYSDLEAYRRILEDRRLDEIVRALERVNGTEGEGEEEEASFEI